MSAAAGAKRLHHGSDPTTATAGEPRLTGLAHWNLPFEFVRCKRTSGDWAIPNRTEGLRCDRKTVKRGLWRQKGSGGCWHGPYSLVESMNSWFEGTKRWAVCLHVSV